MGTTKVDAITFEIIRHKLFRVVDEGIIALENVSGTAVTNEGHDMLVSLFTADGDLLIGGSGYLIHLLAASQAVKHIIKTFSEDPGIFEDDEFLLNDVYAAALHPPDMYMISPIHWKGKVVAFVANFVHVTDVGAINPGGFSPDAKECYHEGFATKGLKLVERGKFRKDVLETILNMVRSPDMVALDFRSQIAANNVAKARMHALMEEYGPEDVDAVSRELISQSEILFRKRLLELPDGTWRSRQYIDLPDKIYTYCLAMTKKSDTLTFDFTGTDEQAAVPINCTYWGGWGACTSAVFPLLSYDITWNDGIIKTLKIVSPKGTLLNCRRPAPTSCATIMSCLAAGNLAALCVSKMLNASPKYKGDSTALWQGGHNVAWMYGINPAGDYVVTALTDTFGGSGGARSFKDGVDIGGETINCVNRWANVETTEMTLPLIYLYREAVRDSGGPGKFRGGVCHEYAITPYDSPKHGLGAIFFNRGVRALSSEGISGGLPAGNIDTIWFKNSIDWEKAKSEGLPSGLESTMKAAEGAEREDHIQWGVYDIKDNDILYMRFMGGGGYGDALERDRDLVLQDVSAGFVSFEAAENIYGVVIDKKTKGLDLEATIQKRRLIRKDRLKGKEVKIDQAVEVKPTEFLINEYLQVAESAEGKFIQCRWCGGRVSDVGENWKDKAAMMESPTTKAGPMRAKTDLFCLREFFCPHCATLLEVEAPLKGDPILYDEILF